MISLILQILVASQVAHIADAQAIWPPWEPVKPPFFDSNCLGKPFDACTASECAWRTQQTPACWSKLYSSVDLPPDTKAEFRANPVPISKLLFTQHFGLHLSEGSINRHYYNTNVEECAARCLRAALGFPTDSEAALLTPTPPGAIKFPARRCLSFDFYPFEDPLEFPPFNEAKDRGICILNTETKDTARARNEDMGYTDAELFYKSHFSKRPFSHLSGYYEVRDSRGGMIADMLDYEASSTVKGELGLAAEWGKSRWGVYHPNLPGYLPKPLNATLNCTAFDPEDVADDPYLVDPDRAFRGGLTPVAIDQHCPGLVTKAEAEVLCSSAGGRLCRDANEIKVLQGRKLGCGFDENNIWHQQKVGTKSTLAYPRCCVTYETPLPCENYSAKRFDDCSSKKRNDECVGLTSGTQRRAQYGFGKLLDFYRERCVFVNREYSLNCEQLLVQRWEQRQPDNGNGPCVWCPKPGVSPGGGEGECRPGNDYGICDGASDTTKRVFGLKVRTYCVPYVNCHISKRFPLLQPFIFPPENRDPTTEPPAIDNCFPFNYDKNGCEKEPGCIWRDEFKLCQPSDQDPPPITCALLTTKKTCGNAATDCHWDPATLACKKGGDPNAFEDDGKPCRTLSKRKACNIRSPRCSWLRSLDSCVASNSIIIGNITDVVAPEDFKKCEYIPQQAAASQVPMLCQAKLGCAWVPETKQCLTEPCENLLTEKNCIARTECKWKPSLGICMS